MISLEVKPGNIFLSPWLHLNIRYKIKITGMNAMIEPCWQILDMYPFIGDFELFQYNQILFTYDLFFASPA